LPKIEHAQHKVGEKIGDSMWKHPNLVLGAIAIFAYVGAEVSIGSFLVNYFSQPEIGGLTERVAAGFVALYWGSAMVGRFIGSALLRGTKMTSMAVTAAGGALMVLISYWLRGRVVPSDQSGLTAFFWQIGAILVSAGPLFALVTVLAAIFAIAAAVRGGQVSAKTGTLLGICALAASLLVGTSMLSMGQVAMWSIILVGLFNSIMFPSIFTLGIAGLGPLTGDGSGLMVMAIVGGAIIPVVQGAIADRIGIHHAFFLPVLCYLYIMFYAFKGSKPVSAH
jgi:FHS family L-fucose permease-like MFS transporter